MIKENEPIYFISGESTHYYLDKLCHCQKKNNNWCFKNGKCIYCKGTKFIPTEQGQAILDFLSRQQTSKRKLPESEWEEEIEGSLSNFGSYEGGLLFCSKNNIYLENLVATYLGVIDTSYPHNKDYESPKVIIKARKKCIQIERI